MNSEGLYHHEPEIQRYFEVWSHSVTSALEHIVGDAFSHEELSPEEAAQKVAQMTDNGLWLHFHASGDLRGEHSVLISKQDALRVSQLVMAEPLLETVAFGDEHRDAVVEFFRQVAATTASALKAAEAWKLGFTFAGMEQPKGSPGKRAVLRFTGSKIAPLELATEINSELAALLQSAQRSDQKISDPGRAGASPAPIPLHDPKLELLMDVELEVTLRFGRRQMLLRDVLELNPGTVVELDRQIHDPVELLVGGKVIARGEAVVVDGNYGLRITEVMSPAERIETLRK